MLRGDVPVLAFDQDNERQLAAGTLMLIANRIDQTTSTIRLRRGLRRRRSIVAGRIRAHRHPGRHQKERGDDPFGGGAARTPGRLCMGDHRRQQGRPARHQGHAVGDDAAIVATGLAAGERVVVNGQYRLRPGVQVDRGAEMAPMSREIRHEYLRARNPASHAMSLLTGALALCGSMVFPLLPVAPLPQVDFPAITVSAQLPGASPETMAATVATPLSSARSRA